MPKRTLTPTEYKHQQALYRKYHQKIVTCPACGYTGSLYFRMQHGTRLWCVRHQYYDENGKWKDTYHHIGVKLPLKIIDQLEGRKYQKKITKFFR